MGRLAAIGAELLVGTAGKVCRAIQAPLKLDPRREFVGNLQHHHAKEGKGNYPEMPLRRFTEIDVGAQEVTCLIVNVDRLPDVAGIPCFENIPDTPLKALPLRHALVFNLVIWVNAQKPEPTNKIQVLFCRLENLVWGFI